MPGGARFGNVQNPTTREALGTAPRPDTSARIRRALPGIIVAIERHRRQTARLLYGLDDAVRTVSTGSPTRADERADAALLISHLAGHLRAGDVQLAQLIAQLDQPTRTRDRGDPPC
jgi:hypothetical protein